jgi:hypothetical protein
MATSLGASVDAIVDVLVGRGMWALEIPVTAGNIAKQDWKRAKVFDVAKLRDIKKV